MKTYKVLKDFTFEGTDYTVGQEIELDEEVAKDLIKEGKIKAV